MPGTLHLFTKLRAELARRGGVDDPAALAAWIKRRVRANPPLRVEPRIGGVWIQHGAITSWWTPTATLVAFQMPGRTPWLVYDGTPSAARIARAVAVEHEVPGLTLPVWPHGNERAEDIVEAGRWPLHNPPLLAVGANPPPRRTSATTMVRAIRGLPNMTARYRDGEFRVNFADGGEATAYYTTDARDAFETAQRMWQSNAKSVAVHRERSYPGMGASPPVLRWNMYAGGTGAAEGKHAYDAMTAIGTYHIDPVHDTHGRHHGYKLRFSVAPGRSSVLPLPGLWSAIAPDGTAVQLEAAPWTFRSPQDAKRAAALHFARYGNGVTDNPGVRDIGNTVNSFHSAVQFLGGRDERKLANNTKVVRAPIVEGAVAVQLHGTFIVTYYPDGRIALNSGGYRSATTKQRLNQLLEGTSLRVEQRHYDWFVVNVRTGQRSDFVDGMVVTDPYATNPPVIARDVEAIEYVHQQDGKRYRHDFSEDRDHGRVRATVQNGGRRVVLEADDGEPIVGEYDT